MLKRPKPGENEDDLLKQQEAFLQSGDLKNLGVTVVKKYDENSTKKIVDEPANVLSEIVEKNLDTKNFTFKFSTSCDSSTTGFPSILARANDEKRQKSKGMSIFMQNFNPKKIDDPKKVTIQEKLKNIDTGCSDVLKKIKSEIHEENVQKLNEMSEEEIFEEQAKLIKTLEPKLVQFIKSRRKHEEKPLETSKKVDIVGEEMIKSFEHLRHQEWLHMDVEEPEKFSWMSQLPENLSNVESTSSQRFDLEGRLMKSEDSHTPVFSGLHHHSDDAQLPGYTIDELLPLCRSALLAQKLLAYKVLTKIANLSKSRAYGDLSDKIFSKFNNLEIFVIVRYGLDDPSEPVIVGACSFLASLLDQPSKQFVRLENDEKFNLNDDEFCRTDFIAALLRMKVLERLRYIMEIIRPQMSICLENILIVLFEIARRCITSCDEIYECPRLILAIKESLSRKSSELTNLERIRCRATNLQSVLLSWETQTPKEMIDKFKNFTPFDS